MTVQRLKVTGVAIGCFAFLAAAPGAWAQTASKCTGGELGAAGKKAAGKAKCWSKATASGVAVDTVGCLPTAESKFSASYSKAVGKGSCDNSTSAGTIETKVDNFITDLVTEINGNTNTPTASKCSSKELGAAGKKAQSVLKCYSKAASKGTPTTTATCISTATSKFSASWTKATSAGSCNTTVAVGTIETKVDNFAADVNSALTTTAPTTTTTTAAPTTTTTTAVATTTTTTHAPTTTTTTAVTTTTTTTHAPTTTTTTTTTSTTTTTTTIASCCGFVPKPSKLNFTTGIGTGNCGTVQLSGGATQKNLACSGLYTGGGGNSVPLPYAVPDMGSSLTGVSACGGTSLTLTNLTSTQTGSNRNCTSVGCLFGPPLPIPNTGSTPTSVCVVNVVATNASGTADCSTGASHLNLPLSSVLYLDGDLFPAAPGIQVCPVCNKTCNTGANNTGPCNTDSDCANAGCTGAGTPMSCCTGVQTGTCTAPGSCAGTNVCHGGGNNGLACTPADSVVGTLSDFPTSQDCPPPTAMNIGSLPIAFDLTTGTKTLTAKNLGGMVPPNVFCGYCRDISASSTGCFEGDPAATCPHNSGCTAAGAPFVCCTGFGTGTCDPQAVTACTANTGAGSCTNPEFPDCQQRTPGAFGPAGQAAHTINETGAPAGPMTDGLAHNSTLASIFCIQPTFNATVDSAGDLPGPGAVTLQGQAQLLP